MNDGKSYKLGGLGSLSLIPENEVCLTERAGCIHYMPPEMLQRQCYDYKVDIWYDKC